MSSRVRVPLPSEPTGRRTCFRASSRLVMNFRVRMVMGAVGSDWYGEQGDDRGKEGRWEEGACKTKRKIVSTPCPRTSIGPKCECALKWVASG